MNKQKLRFVLMLLASVAAFAAAGVSLVSNNGQTSWLTLDFTTAVALGVAAQVWFIVASLKSMKA